ncbi:MAG: hypothetical protein QNI97_07390 [Desulfobacterales bacterium]|nr:hypothetical protein [Desulfobacterales bacterium]MDJ0855090.1 hypothetical protein [Desulfobacterales bacterium]MDJ0988699.1 hypothetical protein [Desulfobacterales bacterium]
MLMMPNCRETARMVSAAMDHRLPLFRRLLLRVHLRMCKYCRRFEQQLLRMRAISRHLDRHLETLDPSVTLPAKARERMRQVLRSHAGSR